MHSPPAASIAYLNTRYPSLSHTFIEREIRAVRASGLEVHPFSIRRPTPNDCLGPAHASAADETYYIFDGITSLILSQFLALFTRPIRFVRTMFVAQQLSPPGVIARTRHFVYALEAIKLAREMHKRGLRHVHVHMANNGAAVAFLTCVFDRSITYSITIHGSNEFYDVHGVSLQNKVENALFVRCISSFSKAQIMVWCRPDFWDKLHIVHCGLEVADFPPRPPLADGPLRILAVARFDPIKGLPLLLEACRQLSDDGIDWKLDLVGDGPTGAKLQATARELGISDRIHFAGAVGQDAIQKHYDTADVLVISSFMEGIPVVLMEAMAKQLAVVSTNIGGIPELIDPNVNGLLVPPAAPQRLACALKQLAHDRQLTARLGLAGRQRILEQFAAADTGSHMVDLFKQYGIQASPSKTTAVESPLPGEVAVQRASA